MTDTPENNDTQSETPSESTPKTTKKTTKKKTTKKTTKKVAKKTTKKTTKKVTKKKTSKRVAKKADQKVAEAEKVAEIESQEIDTPQIDQPEEAAEPVSERDNEEASVDSESQKRPSRRPSRRRSRSKATTEATAEETTETTTEETADTAPKRTTKKTTKKTATRTTTRTTKKTTSSRSKADQPAPLAEMIINYVPGEECRVAMIEDGKLEELMVEPTDRVSRVGNIYVGRVTNIEPSIQAVFVDFGIEDNGFLHVSDLHPQYFAKGDERTERVGKKTPRKSRPPVQDCLKRGQEIIVQVLKEGVGTKGPTLTSYLSIPGRFLVMMPGMDKVGVSRKEEDEDKRKAAKQILSQLELPDGFGFILRTAGFDRNKAELKRDLSYLGRLWKDMESARKGGNRPRLLYTESDLLVRSIRDLLTSEVSRVVIDSEPALKRVARFIKIAAPRSGAKLSHYTGTKPIFHAFGIESQINEIHAREVALPSGGRLVIDQTEALVAIDVNSGKSRSARDAETNAFKTNMEAVDAICRQLRLRDLGGLVVNDMIDMRFHSHRKEVEARFNERLKRDRAKSSTAPISQFGLLEMTRQRMRGSMESQHFADCPMCHGRGLVKRPDSVAASALRDLATLLDHEKVHRAELVVNPRVASSLLSVRRTNLTRIELVSGKELDVRVSESLPIDRVSFYAYDARGADINIEMLKPAPGKRAEPSVVEWRDESSPDGSWAMDPLDEIDETTVHKLAEEIARKAEEAENVQLPVEGDLDDDGEPFKKKRRRRRGGRGRGRSEDGSNEDQSNDSNETEEQVSDSGESTEDRPVELDENGEPIKRRRRRRGGRGRGRSEEGSSERSEGQSTDSREAEQRTSGSDESTEDRPVELDENGEPIKRRRRRRGGRGRSRSGEGENTQTDSSPEDQSREARPQQTASANDSSQDETYRDESTSEQQEPRPRRRPRRRPSKVSQDDAGQESNRDTREDSSRPEADRVTEPKPQRTSRRRSRSRDSSDERSTPEAKAPAQPTPKPAAKPASQPEAEKPKPRRGLYSNSRRTLSPSELAKLGLE